MTSQINPVIPLQGASKLPEPCFTNIGVPAKIVKTTTMIPVSNDNLNQGDPGPTDATTYNTREFEENNDAIMDQINGNFQTYFNHWSGPSFIRIIDTPHIWGMPFGKEIMPKAIESQAGFERALVEIIQKAKYRCDLSSLNCPDPDWMKAILGAMDTALTANLDRTQRTQFRFLFGQTPITPVGQPYHYIEFKAALIRLFRARSSHWELMPEIWMGRFFRLDNGLLSKIQASMFGEAVLDGIGTRLTWNHTKIISVDGTEALVGGHNLNMDLFRSYPPVHDVSAVVHGEPAHGAQLFLNKMWEAGVDLLTKESLNVNSLTWQNRDEEEELLPRDPLIETDAAHYVETAQQAIIDLHRNTDISSEPAIDENDEHVSFIPHVDGITQESIREDDLRTLEDLRLNVFQERIVYDSYDKIEEYKEATRMLTVGKYWDGPDYFENYQQASELMKELLIRGAKRIIRISQMDLISAWKSRWSQHLVCNWILEALLANKNLEVQIVVSPLDAGAGVAGDQYSFGSGASRTFELLKYYMTHDIESDEPFADPEGVRVEALKRLHVAPFFYTDQVPVDKTTEGSTYKWPDLTEEGKTATLKQRPLSEVPPDRDKINSAFMSVVRASGFFYTQVESAPGNHAKIMIVDDEVYVIGSDNLYPGFLSEINYLVEGPEAVNELINSYWNPLWKYSEPHSISG
ncbi:phospholipase D-like domain-containing protein [Sphingobacterium chungjuense]|uniref:hypothetical protein n=1 Tax=Sphingobacterium chungjuense TaxID=2675553 RepID=UPI0019D1D7F7|nr:hypothetical protein [Sphingobacterium chungjuense]